MKLRNKKTGEIGILALNINPNRESYSVLSTENGDTICGNSIIDDYNSLAKLNADWEDAPEEPKKHYEILGMGVVIEQEDAEDEIFRNQNQREIGNYFSSREEAVEKLKAFKRLKDRGFRFEGWTIDDGLKISICTNMDSAREDIYEDDKEKLRSDLDTCFGGEE